jgi:hypothetical protein
MCLDGGSWALGFLGQQDNSSCRAPINLDFLVGSWILVLGTCLSFFLWSKIGLGLLSGLDNIQSISGISIHLLVRFFTCSSHKCFPFQRFLVFFFLLCQRRFLLRIGVQFFAKLIRLRNFAAR